MESMFRTRESLDHEATLAIKCQFMALWDGLLSAEPNQILVVGMHAACMCTLCRGAP